jgi:hypothetical protein
VKPLSFEFEFEPSANGSAEERATMAELRVTAGDEVATRVDDSWARSVRERIRVSCYPLATWFAGSWWRLLNEAPSTTKGEQSLGWRMSHQLVAAGGGYLWPRLTFRPDGEGIDLECSASRKVLAEPLRFLSSFHTSAEKSDVETELASFISSVVARLDAIGLGKTELHHLWADVQGERAVPKAARYRELEAELGFDPDEGPESLVAALTKLEETAGASAVEEVANAAGSWRAASPVEFVRQVKALAQGGGMAARFDSKLASVVAGERSARPWQRGRDVASKVRGLVGVPRGPITDEVLAALLGGDFVHAVAAGPIGLAVRTGDRHATVHFRRAHPFGRRFEAARVVAEQVLAPPEDSWLAATDAATARQKAQRAFAAEFLVPIADLAERLNGDFSDERLETVAGEYQVSPLTLSAHLANNGLLDPGDVQP